MPTALDLKPWRDELKDVLDVCAQRASLPVTLPHCAICARYSTDHLPFEALLSLLDVVPERFLPEALAAAEDRLRALPPAMRQQQVDAVTLPVLMASPGWPLVRGLVIDMSNQEVHRYFNDPRLGAIEEITLLGFAYGGCNVQPAFHDALFNSRGFPNVRSLLFHSTESDADMSRQFWASPLARQLERIDGVPYFGDPVAGPLAVRQLRLDSYGDLPEGFSLRPLLDPSTSPRLASLSLSAYFEGVGPFLQLLADEGSLLERIDTVSLHLSDFRGEESHLLRPATLPASVRSVSWHSQFRHVSYIRIRSGSDLHPLYDSISAEVDIRFCDKVTDYGGLVFDWRLRDEISRRVHDLALLLPLQIDLAHVLAFCTELPKLQRLTLVYPFTEAELEALLRSERIRRLEALTLFLSVHSGQWDSANPNEYMKANVARYRSSVPAKWLFQWAFSQAPASIPNLSVAAQSFELTRSPERVQHCDLRTEEAAYALVEADPRRPIEVLCLDYNLPIDERLASALTRTDLLRRVYRLDLRARLDEPAARLFAGCRHLCTVRAFSHFCYHNALPAIQTILYSANLTGVWDLYLYLPDSHNEESIAALCAESPLLDRVVALDLHGPHQSPLLPRGGRLGRLRRLGEWLSMHVFGDARLAAVWSDCPLGRPLRARLVRFVEQTYHSQHTPEDLPVLESKLLSFVPCHDESGFEETLRALLATAFAGKPAAENATFADLSAPEQSALRTIARVDEAWWNVGGMMNDLLTSYGLRCWGKKRLERYIAGTEAAFD